MLLCRKFAMLQSTFYVYYNKILKYRDLVLNTIAENY